MKPRIIFIHGNQTTHWSWKWVVWLKQELERAQYPVFFETFPDSIIARAKYWIPFLEEHVKAGEQDVLVGWSSGAVAAMRYAETHKILGSVLISPCYTDTNDELEKQSGYYDTPWNWTRIREDQKQIALVHSSNDPYIPLQEFKVITEQLKPTVILLPDGKHFIEQDHFPEVLEYIVKTYA